MAVHTVAFYGDELASGQFDEVPAVKDMTMMITTNNRVILSQDMNIIAGYVGAEPEETGEFFDCARVSAPSLRKVVSPYIVPSSKTLIAENDPPMMSLTNWPWRVSRQEEISIEARTTSIVSPVTPLAVVGLLWFEDRREPVPTGENFWIRYTGTTPTKGVNTPVEWEGLTISYDQTLAAGRYAVIGYTHKSDLTFCARLIFDDQVWRPGTLVTVPAAARTHDDFYNGSMGVLGCFESYSPPRVEVLRTQEATVGSVEGFLRIVRLAGPSSMRGASSSDTSKGNYG